MKDKRKNGSLNLQGNIISMYSKFVLIIIEIQ